MLLLGKKTNRLPLEASKQKALDCDLKLVSFRCPSSHYLVEFRPLIEVL